MSCNVEKPEKMQKHESKVVFYFWKHRFSCQNTSRKARFFCQY
jgi:hypothetical protein